MLESPFNKFAGFKTSNFLKKRPQHRCFSVNIAKCLRTLILVKTCEQLLLQFLLLTVNISSWVFVSALNSIGLLQRSSSRFKEFSLECLVVGSSLIWKKRKISRNGHSLSFVVTRCTTQCHSLSLVVTLCHLLSLVVIRCHSLYHSLSLVFTRCTTRLPFYKRSKFYANKNIFYKENDWSNKICFSFHKNICAPWSKRKFKISHIFYC